MKRIIKSKLLKTVLVLAVFMLTGCGQNEQQAEQQNTSDIVTQQSEPQYATDIVTFQMVPSSNGVEDYIEQVFGDDYDEENAGGYYNVVPEDISNDYGFSIFKNDFSGYSELVYDNKKYTLGEWVGGPGVTSFAIADLNEDSEFEIYFTYSYGSGEPRSEVGYFDTASKKTVIFDFEKGWELLLEVDSNNILCVYDADFDTYNRKSDIDIEMSAREKLASIVADNGEITLVVESD